jgi:hypothetical protein
MAKEFENIELRSEKVRSIIGQIPPRLMRIGVSLIFLVFTFVLIGSYFFEYEYTIKTTATISKQRDLLCVTIKVPVNESNRILKGQKLILNFDNIPNMYGQRTITSLPLNTSTIQITEKGGYYISEFYLPESIKNESGNKLEVQGTFFVNAEIQTGKIRFFDRIFEPIKEIFKQRK